MEKTYSTPLVQKLGIKENSTITVINAPAHYKSTLGNLPKGARVSRNLQTNSSIIQFFAKSRQELVKNFLKLKSCLSPAGALWICWPKKTSSIKSDINENVVIGEGLKNGLVDIKVIKVDEYWSALKFVYRIQDR